MIPSSRRSFLVCLAASCCPATTPATNAPKPRSAVIVVDMQADFTEAHQGSLAVAGTDVAYLKAVAKATAQLKAAGHLIYATQDWHPADHVSFHSNHKDHKPFDVIKLRGNDQVLWPPHCIQKSKGAAILLDPSLFTGIVQKGKDQRFDSYSGFKDDGGSRTEMEAVLRKAGVTEIIVYGVATDYCVRATALDAAAAGFQVTMVQSLCRGVAPESIRKAIADLKSAGVTVTDSLPASALQQKR
jgi:nicotinamidase/pyrazinamidase